MSWCTSELRVRLAPLNRFKPSSKIFYWPFQGSTSFVDLLCFVLSCVCYVFVRVCLYVLCDHLLGKGWPLGSRLWCLLWVCHFPIGILGQVWYLIVSIPDLCTLTYYATWPCFEKLILTFWPLPQGRVGVGGGLRAKYMLLRFAFVILFNLVCNLTMFWKRWILTSGSGDGGERGSAGKIFATMLLHSCFSLMWYATWSSSEKVEFWRFDPTH